MEKKEEMTKKLNDYFGRKYKEFSNNYEVIIKPIHDIDISSNENIKSIINSVFLVDNTGKGSTQQIYKLVKALAYFLNDDLTEQELDEIVKSSRKVPSVYHIEKVIEKYMKLNTKLDKHVMYLNTRYALSDLSSILQKKKTQIYMIFIRLLKENDIQVPFSMPDFNGLQHQDIGEL